MLILEPLFYSVHKGFAYAILKLSNEHRDEMVKGHGKDVDGDKQRYAREREREKKEVYGRGENSNKGQTAQC